MHDVADLYLLQPEQVLELPGFAQRSTEKLLQAIAAQVAHGGRYWLLTLHPKCPPDLPRH
mgnify:CR=1 FL=1